MSLVINIYYTGKCGNAKKFVNEMIQSGTVDLIRKEPGNLGYDYFFCEANPETVLLIDKWKDKSALDAHHKTAMMNTIAELRKKYNLSMRVEQFYQLDGESVGDFDEVISKRTAIRKFSNNLLSDEILQKILEAGRKAPTAKNMQPQVIYVIKSNDAHAKLDLATPCRYGAPVCLLVCADKSQAWSSGDYSSYEMDATIVATHMMLEATNLGVDNIWVKNFDSKILKNEFELSENIVPVCLMPLGYRAPDCPINPMHNVRKELDSFVFYK